MVDFRTSYCKSSLCMHGEKIHAYGMHKLEQFYAHCGLAVNLHIIHLTKAPGYFNVAYCLSTKTKIWRTQVLICSTEILFNISHVIGEMYRVASKHPYWKEHTVWHTVWHCGLCENARISRGTVLNFHTVHSATLCDCVFFPVGTNNPCDSNVTKFTDREFSRSKII